MRSALTVLGVVIGITSIVGMTALIRGFDQSLRDMIRAIGPNTIFVQRFGVTSFASGTEITRPAEAAEPDGLRRARASRSRPTRSSSSTSSSAPAARRPSSASSTATRRRSRSSSSARRENFADGTRIPLLAGRFFNGTEVQFRKNVVVLGNTAYQLLFAADRRRSDRQDRPRRQRAVRGGRRLRQAARRPAASTSARTTSSSSRTRPTSASSA